MPESLPRADAPRPAEPATRLPQGAPALLLPAAGWSPVGSLALSLAVHALAVGTALVVFGATAHRRPPEGHPGDRPSVVFVAPDSPSPVLSSDEPDIQPPPELEPVPTPPTPAMDEVPEALDPLDVPPPEAAFPEDPPVEVAPRTLKPDPADAVGKRVHHSTPSPAPAAPPAPMRIAILPPVPPAPPVAPAPVPRRSSPGRRPPLVELAMPLPPRPAYFVSDQRAVVEIQYTITADGDVTDVRVTGSSGDPDLDEATRVLVEERWRYVAPGEVRRVIRSIVYGAPR